MAETLTKLEREVLGSEIRGSLGRRRAVIRIAPPLDVEEFLAAESGGASRDDTIEAIVIRLHEALQGALDSIARETRGPGGSARG
jgi:hypothetical protein